MKIFPWLSSPRSRSSQAWMRLTVRYIRSSVAVSTVTLVPPPWPEPSPICGSPPPGPTPSPGRRAGPSARSASSIAEQCSAPLSTTAQQVPHSPLPPQTVGQNQPWRPAAAISDSPASTSSAASAGSTRTRATASVAGQVPVDDVMHVGDPGFEAREPEGRSRRAPQAGLLRRDVAQILVHHRPAGFALGDDEVWLRGRERLHRVGDAVEVPHVAPGVVRIVGVGQEAEQPVAEREVVDDDVREEVEVP